MMVGAVETTVAVQVLLEDPEPQLHGGEPVLRDEDGQHWLVTPFEKARIEVEDAALIAVDVSQRGDGLAFRLNTDDLVVAGPENRLLARGDEETPSIYLQVRRGLEAKLNRSTYQQLAEIALAAGDDWTVSSLGETFTLLPA